MITVARVAYQLNPRRVILSGMLLAGGATWIRFWYNLDISPGWIIRPGLLPGIGMGSICVTLSTLAYATLAPDGSSERPCDGSFSESADWDENRRGLTAYTLSH